MAEPFPPLPFFPLPFEPDVDEMPDPEVVVPDVGDRQMVRPIAAFMAGLFVLVLAECIPMLPAAKLGHWYSVLVLVAVVAVVLVVRQVRVPMWWLLRRVDILGDASVGRGVSAYEWAGRFLRRVQVNSGIDDDAERVMGDALGEILDPDEDIADLLVKTEGRPTVVRVNRRPRYCRILAAQLKERYPFHTLNRSSADLLSVRAAAVSAMEKHGLRPSHRATLLPLVEALVFTPSREEIVHQRFLQSRIADDHLRFLEQRTDDHVLDRWLGTGRRATYTRH